MVGRNGRVEQAVALHNHEARRHAFAVDPDQIAAIAQDIQDQDIQDTGCRLLGRFHTHWTGRVTPSLRDLAPLPQGWAEMIICLRGHGAQPDITSMRLFDGQGLVLPLRFETGEGPDDGGFPFSRLRGRGALFLWGGVPSRTGVAGLGGWGELCRHRPATGRADLSHPRARRMASDQAALLAQCGWQYLGHPAMVRDRAGRTRLQFRNLDAHHGHPHHRIRRFMPGGGMRGDHRRRGAAPRVCPAV
ncbi:hypothetical protein [uncultured Celeribacter sp.]|uniref:hypothetical protein n=1 Tax=uncultured Celeribacter sp. TaxID=1303376 RepID=UPI0037483D23